MTQNKRPEQPQLQKFIQAAKELECDEDEKSFDDKLRRIAPNKDKEKPADQRVFCYSIALVCEVYNWAKIPRT